MRRFSWIVTVPITLAAILFAIANRDPATVSFWPSSLILDVPTYVLVLGCMLLGFLFGTMVAWFSGGERRRRYRRLVERVQAQASQLAEMRSENARPVPVSPGASGGTAPGGGSLPALRTVAGTRG